MTAVGEEPLRTELCKIGKKKKKKGLLRRNTRAEELIIILLTYERVSLPVRIFSEQLI